MQYIYTHIYYMYESLYKPSPLFPPKKFDSKSGDWSQCCCHLQSRQLSTIEAVRIGRGIEILPNLQILLEILIGLTD